MELVSSFPRIQHLQNLKKHFNDVLKPTEQVSILFLRHLGLDTTSACCVGVRHNCNMHYRRRFELWHVFTMTQFKLGVNNSDPFTSGQLLKAWTHPRCIEDGLEVICQNSDHNPRWHGEACGPVLSAVWTRIRPNKQPPILNRPATVYSRT